jgi:hypothetical protein
MKMKIEIEPINIINWMDQINNKNKRVAIKYDITSVL